MLAGTNGKSAEQWETALTQQLLRQNDEIYSGYAENPQARAILAGLQREEGVSMSAEETAEFTNHAINARYLSQLAQSNLRVPTVSVGGRNISPRLDNLTWAYA